MIDRLLPYLWAFSIGGALCVIAQILIDRTKLTPARILVLYVVVGVFLGAIGVYKPLAEFGRRSGSGGKARLTRRADGRACGNLGRHCGSSDFRLSRLPVLQGKAEVKKE